MSTKPEATALKFNPDVNKICIKIIIMEYRNIRLFKKSPYPICSAKANKNKP